jgi:PAS domain-containing protein
MSATFHPVGVIEAHPGGSILGCMAVPLAGAAAPAAAAVPDSFSIGEAAAILGLPAHTLRAWERRYDVLEPGRTAGNQRRYTVDDLRALGRLKEAASGPGRSLRRALVEERACAAGGAPAWRADRPGARSAHDHQPVWRFVADRFSDLVLIVDETGRLVDANEAAATALRMQRERLLWCPLPTLADPRDGTLAASLAAGQQRQQSSCTLRLRGSRTGSAFRFDCLPLRYRDRQLLVLIGRPQLHD